MAKVKNICNATMMAIALLSAQPIFSAQADVYNSKTGISLSTIDLRAEELPACDADKNKKEGGSCTSGDKSFKCIATHLDSKPTCSMECRDGNADGKYHWVKDCGPSSSAPLANRAIF